jgi:hypothetical protein
MSYDPVVDWYNIAPVIVGAAAVVAAYFGARTAAKRSNADARQPRGEDLSIEHAQWMRDRRADIYVDTIAIREFRAMLRSRILHDVTAKEPELEPPSNSSAGILFARMHLWGSDRAGGLLQDAFIAEQRCVNLHAQWRDGMTNSRSTSPLRREVDEALMEADIADESLIEYLRQEIQRPIPLQRNDGDLPAPRDSRPMPGRVPAADASEVG